MTYAKGRLARAICDRCGFECKASTRRREWTGLLVCPGCWEEKHPQLEPTRKRLDDPRPIREPRPEDPSPPIPADQLIENIFPSTAGQKFTP